MSNAFSGVEVVEARLMLTTSADVEATIDSSNQVVDQYSQQVQQEYLAPAQTELEASLSAFMADTSALSSSSSLSSEQSPTPIDSYWATFGMSDVDPTAGSQEYLADAQASTSQSSDSTTDAGTSASDSGSTSLFEQDANLQSYAQSLVQSAFGDSTTSSSSDGTSSSFSEGSESSTTDSSSSSDDGGGTSSDTGSSSGEDSSDSSSDGSGGDSSSGSSGTTGGGSSGSSGGTTTTTTSPGWQPFVLPAGISFEEVHLPAESAMGNLRALQPTGTDSFTQTIVTETATTRLVVTRSQTYVTADQWQISQSWTKQYTVTQSSGDPLALGPWSSSTRSRLTTFSIIVSNGFGIPSPPAFRGSRVLAASAASSAALASAVPSSAATTTVVVPIGPVSTVTFSDSDSLSTSNGDSTDDSDVTTGKVDTSSFAGNSKFSALKQFVLTEFLVMRPDLTLGHTRQASFGTSMDRTMSFNGKFEQFAAEGTVLDALGNPTTVTSNPHGSPIVSRGSLPPTDASDVLDDTAAPIPTGGNGTRFTADGSVEASATESEGSSFTAEATTDVGEVDLFADSTASIGVTDSLSYEDQESDTTTGNFDYLSLGWSDAGNADVAAGFDLAVSLDDADLLDAESSSSDSSSSPSFASFATSVTSGPASSATEPTQGEPVIDLECNESVGTNGRTFLQYDYKNVIITPPNSSNLLAAPWTETSKGAVSLRMGGGASISAKMELVGWTPTVTIQSSGNVGVSYVTAGTTVYEFDTFGQEPPAGYVLTQSDHQRYFNSSDTTSGTIVFNVTVTISATAEPSLTGTITVDITHKVIDQNGCYSHDRFENPSDASDFIEYWSQVRTTYIGSVKTTGGIGSGAAELKIEVKENWDCFSETITTGTPPAPPAPAEGAPSIFTQALDVLQFGLDVAGMVPVAGEVCDLSNAIISAGRGNTGDAMLSIGAMIPFGGAAVTAGKIGQKAMKALAKNADKLDEAAAGVKAIANKVDDAAKATSSAPKALPLTNRPHGGSAHDDAIMERISELGDKARDIRKNQTQVNVLEQQVSNLRPDLQFTEDNLRTYVQVINTNPATRVVELLDADPKGIVEIIF